MARRSVGTPVAGAKTAAAAAAAPLDDDVDGVDPVLRAVELLGPVAVTRVVTRSGSSLPAGAVRHV